MLAPLLTRLLTRLLAPPTAAGRSLRYPSCPGTASSRTSRNSSTAGRRCRFPTAGSRILRPSLLTEAIPLVDDPPETAARKRRIMQLLGC